jgi:hypothetical protein
MSMHYLMEWANDRNFWDWFNQSENRAYVVVRGQLTQQPEAYGTNLTHAGLKPKDKSSEFETSDLPLHFFKDATSGPYRVAILDNKGQRQAHAMACCLGPQIRVFDVSEGEFVFDTAAEAEQWLQPYLRVSRINIDLGGGKIIKNSLSYITGMPKCTLYKYEKAPPPPSDLPPPPPRRPH